MTQTYTNKVKETNLRDKQQATQDASDIIMNVYDGVSANGKCRLLGAKLHLDDTQDWTTPELEPDFKVTQIR